MNSKRLARIAISALLMFVVHVGLAGLPNIELVSLLILLYSRVWSKDVLFITIIYVLFTGIYWGMGLWWVTYLFVWPAFGLFCNLILKRVNDWFLLAIILGMFGLTFGFYFAIPYALYDPVYAFNYWIMGIPFDVMHSISNFAGGIFLGYPLSKVFIRIRDNSYVHND
ncbi:MAG: hypothetical protein PHQ32_00625 [Firmicutes bacterium]|nr:hypothetical protein [Bacillota bacterium]